MAYENNTLPPLQEESLEGGTLHSEILAETASNTETQSQLEQMGGGQTVAIPSQSSSGLTQAIESLMKNVNQGNADAQFDNEIGQSGGARRRTRRIKRKYRNTRKSRKSKKSKKQLKKSRKQTKSKKSRTNKRRNRK